MKYRLDVLNDKDFELLAKDVLEAESGLSFQSFRSGKDKGIDLRCALNKENGIIIQAKHYLNSTFSDLKLKVRQEKAKMDGLKVKPVTYILFTSFDLNVAQSDELTGLLQPYVGTSQNIYGRSRIEELIEKYYDIERRHFKLWMTSTNIMLEILHNGIRGRSDFAQEQILKRIKLYVPTQNFKEAVDKVREHHFLMITGEPGVGKTTIAHLLVCEFLADGYELVMVDEKIADAEDLLSPDPMVKQIIFFDDFLGGNIHDVMHPSNGQSKIVSFVERIMASANKYLIMTTRTTILNQATESHDKLKIIAGMHFSNYHLLLNKYSYLDKARILYNHLYHTVEGSKRIAFFHDKFYLKVIRHPNFFPRLIEFITSGINRQNLDIEDARLFILESMDNPSAIWSHAFTEQLKFEDQFLLCTLFSMGGSRVEEDCLRAAFDKRYSFEIQYNGHKRQTNAYQTSLKKLSDGFFRIYKDQYGKLEVSLLNPSISDFLLNFYKSSPDEVKRLFFSVLYLEQILTFFGTARDKISLPVDQLESYYERFVDLAPGLDFFSPLNSSKEVSILYIYFEFFFDQVQIDVILPLVKAINLDDFFANEFQYWYVLEYVLEFPDAKQHVKENWKDYFMLGIDTATDEGSFNNFISLLKRYDIPVEVWSNDLSFFTHVSKAANRLYVHYLPDLDLSGYREDIWETFHGQSAAHAEKIINGVVMDKFSIFTNDCGLADFSQEIWDDLDFDVKRILDEHIELWEADTHVFEPSVTADDAWVRDPLQDENDAIKALFEQ